MTTNAVRIETGLRMMPSGDRSRDRPGEVATRRGPYAGHDVRPTPLHEYAMSFHSGTCDLPSARPAADRAGRAARTCNVSGMSRERIYVLADRRLTLGV